MRRTPIVAVLLLLSSVVAGCGSDSTTSASLSFSGTWRGTFGTSTPSNVTWTATQSGSTVTGPAVVTIVGISGVQFTGTISGVVASNQLQLAVAVPPGAIAVLPACSIAGSGTTTTASATSIVAPISVVFSQACVGTVTTQATATAQLVLTKQ